MGLKFSKLVQVNIDLSKLVWNCLNLSKIHRIDPNLVLKYQTLHQSKLKNGTMGKNSKCPTGQLISECPFDVLNFPKTNKKLWQLQKALS